jgi:hypothetical protein
MRSRSVSAAHRRVHAATAAAHLVIVRTRARERGRIHCGRTRPVEGRSSVRAHIASQRVGRRRQRYSPDWQRNSGGCAASTASSSAPTRQRRMATSRHHAEPALRGCNRPWSGGAATCPRVLAAGAHHPRHLYRRTQPALPRSWPPLLRRAWLGALGYAFSAFATDAAPTLPHTTDANQHAPPCASSSRVRARCERGATTRQCATLCTRTSASTLHAAQP